MVRQLPLVQKVGTGNTGTTTNTGEASGNTGSTALSISQMPWHSHSLQYAVIGSGGGVNNIYGIPYGGATSNGSILYSSEHKPSGELRFGISAAGSGEGHTHTLNNHQHTIPYIECYVWKRTA